MKYIYIHGNQYWYQRAVPNRLVKILGKSTLKISLKTNKVPTAIKRAKLQALEHKKMFNEIKKNSDTYLKKIFGRKIVDIEKFSLEFIDDYDDLVDKVLFSKKELISHYKIQGSSNSNQKLNHIILEEEKKNPLLSQVLNEYLKLKCIFEESKKSKSIRKSVDMMIEFCGDKHLTEYSSIDARNFRDKFVNINKISTGKRNQSNIQNLFNVVFNHYSIDKRNPFSGLKWPENKSVFTRQIFSRDELSKIKKFCLENDSDLALICGLIYDTGCSFAEIIGLANEDVKISKYNPYIVIRSNKFRSINNIYKRRVIPLVGLSLLSVKKNKNSESGSLFFNSYINNKQSFLALETRLNEKVKKFSNGKTCISFKYTLIERLKEIGCPEQIIYDVIGLANKESFYGNETTFDIKSSWLGQVVNDV